MDPHSFCIEKACAVCTAGCSVPPTPLHFIAESRNILMGNLSLICLNWRTCFFGTWQGEIAIFVRGGLESQHLKVIQDTDCVEKQVRYESPDVFVCKMSDLLMSPSELVWLTNIASPHKVSKNSLSLKKKHLLIKSFHLAVCTFPWT